MNPMHWPRRHLLALAIAALVGVVVGAVVGYFVHAAAHGASGGTCFDVWLERPLRYGGLRWAITGALVGAALVSVRRLLDEPGDERRASAGERFFNWEARPAGIRPTPEGGIETFFVRSDTSSWSSASPIEVLESGVELSRDEFDVMYPDTPRVPRTSRRRS